MPGNGFTFAVRVRRQEDFFSVVCGFLELLYYRLFVLQDLVLRLEILSYVDSQPVSRKVSDVTDRGFHLEVTAKNLADSLGFLGGLDYY